MLKGDPGAEMFQALKTERRDIEAELSAVSDTEGIAWKQRGDLCWVEVKRQFSGGWTVEQESAQLEWLLTATNTFVNTFRPRVLRLLSAARSG